MKIHRLFSVAVLAVLILTSSVYAMKIREYLNGQWVECDTENPDGCNMEHKAEIPLEKEVGVYELPVRINGVVTLKFILDTGASEVNIPANVASMLLRTGAIGPTDFLPGRSYRLADGSIVRSSRLMLRELEIGGIKVRAVPASIGPAAGSLLLGQSFLGRLESWSLDNKKNILVIGGGNVHPQ
jgi:clan AA aspartic protease (TIGR02281 family)